MQLLICINRELYCIFVVKGGMSVDCVGKHFVLVKIMSKNMSAKHSHRTSTDWFLFFDEYFAKALFCVIVIKTIKCVY